jgi:hypothetical protein
VSHFTWKCPRGLDRKAKIIGLYSVFLVSRQSEYLINLVHLASVVGYEGLSLN